jgi:RHS repeat-associated protein
MGFAGMELDSVTGLNLAVYRVQDPGTGRWTSQDPLGFRAGDTNLQRYVGANAENGADPSGLEQTAGGSRGIPDDLEWSDGWWYLNPVVQGGISQAWNASNKDGKFIGERGGWIYYNPKTGTFRVVPFQLPPGPQKKPPRGRKPAPKYHMDPLPPAPGPGECTVGFFHTHGDDNGYQSGRDRHFANRHHLPSRVVTGPGKNDGSTYVPLGYPQRLN